MKKSIVYGALLFVVSQTCNAALIGTELSLDTVFQSTSTSTIELLSFSTTATVVEPGIEFSSVAALEVVNPPLGLRLVDTSINVGDNFIEIDFDNTGAFNRFTSAFQNTYIFTFDSIAALNIIDASIDTSLTTLGLSADDVTFSGRQLFVNVEGLSFNTSTFARINLTSNGGVSAVPLPASLWLFGSGLLALVGFKRVKNA